MSMTMKRALFIDRDGTIIEEPCDEQIDSLEKLTFVPGVFRHLGDICASHRFELVMVSNQDGLGTSSFPEDSFWPAHNKMLEALRGEGIEFDEILIDRSFAHDNLETRKPGTGLLTKYLTGNYDLGRSFVIGDRLTDVELAKNLGTKAFLFGNGSCGQDVLEAGLAETLVQGVDNWQSAARYLLGEGRSAECIRRTNETEIQVRINLDGSAKADISTGIGFFDHMLMQVAKHSGCDLDIKVCGDLEVDEHHTIEDTAIALGECFKKALGNKRGIERYGYCLPMDDCLAQIALDFGGRPWLVWQAEFRREFVGQMPTEMFMHFFKSFSDACACNLNVKAEGSNEHHKIEAIFKAFARALKMAIEVKHGSFDLPSTKGVL